MVFRSPIGRTDFSQIRREGFAYVDKSRLISQLLQDPSLVVLLTRPRRFGKTTNLSMLQAFFDLPREGDDRQPLFSDLEVWQDAAARTHFQRHPVISLSLKEIKPASWAKCRADLAQLIAGVFRSHVALIELARPTDAEQRQVQTILSGDAESTTLERSLVILSALLWRATGARVVVLIDEYDTPIHAAWLNGYYREVVDFFRVFLGAGLKDNPTLERGVLTGILRVSRESICSDLNNLTVYSVLRERYGDAFGFTEDEVAALAASAGASKLLPTIRKWYNGYHFGAATIYNPWSVLNLLSSEDRVARPYWVNTSSNELVGRLITSGGTQLSADLATLLQGGQVRKPIDDGLTLPDLERRVDALWSLLLYSGYLTSRSVHRGGLEATLRVPNREVMLAYDTLLQRWMERALGDSAEIQAMLRAMLEGDVETFEAQLSQLVVEAMSFQDLSRPEPERIYHAFTLGLLVQLRATHRVESNRESGFGRADVLVIPRKTGAPGVVLEFKRVREGEGVEAALDSALLQIRERSYAARLVEAGASPVRCYGVAFDGKAVHILQG